MIQLTQFAPPLRLNEDGIPICLIAQPMTYGGYDRTRTAGRQRWFFRVMLAAMCQHLDAWTAHATAND